MRYIIFTLFTFLFFTSAFSINPDREYNQRPEKYNLVYNELKVEVNSKIFLNLWDYAENRKTSDKTIIIVGGDAGNMGYLVDDAANLISLGFHVITFDYRGFGSSSDFNIEKSQLYYDEFSNDLSSVIQYARKTYPSHKIGLFAFSMGTLISYLTFQKECYDFFIGDGVIYNPADVVERIKNNFHKDFNLPSNTKYRRELIKGINIPMLLFAGTNDIITTVDDCKKIININRQSQIIKYDGGHLSGYKTLKKEYYKNIQGFINKL